MYVNERVPPLSGSVSTNSLCSQTTAGELTVRVQRAYTTFLFCFYDFVTWCEYYLFVMFLTKVKAV